MTGLKEARLSADMQGENNGRPAWAKAGIAKAFMARNVNVTAELGPALCLQLMLASPVAALACKAIH